MNNNRKPTLEKDNTHQEPEEQDISAVQMLKRRKSTPLQARTNFSNNQHDSKKANKENKPYRKKQSINSRVSQFNILTDAKVKLAEFMTEDFKEKSKIEMQILNT